VKYGRLAVANMTKIFASIKQIAPVALELLSVVGAIVLFAYTETSLEQLRDFANNGLTELV